MFVFISFQIFTSVVCFGLFHGLTFLPVVLSLIGPKPYGTNITDQELKEYTDITYRNDDLVLQEFSKSKTASMNGHIHSGIPRSISQINEGFDSIAGTESPPVSHQ